MTELAYPLPEIGEPSIAADPRTLTALQNIKAWSEGQIDSTNIKAGSIETGPLKNEAVTEPKLSIAVQALLNAKTSGLAVKARGLGSYTATAGELGILFPTTGTITTPTIAANLTFGVINISTVAKIKTAAAGQFIGNGREFGKEIPLAKEQGIILQSDGANWYIISGGTLYTVGTGTATWPGGGGESGETTITHGLGIIPSVVTIANTNGASTQQPVVYIVTEKTSTTFKVKGYGATTSALVGTFDWAAFL